MANSTIISNKAAKEESYRQFVVLREQGMELIDIAKQLNIKPTTISGNDYEWRYLIEQDRKKKHRTDRTALRRCLTEINLRYESLGDVPADNEALIKLKEVVNGK